MFYDLCIIGIIKGLQLLHLGLHYCTCVLLLILLLTSSAKSGIILHKRWKALINFLIIDYFYLFYVFQKVILLYPIGHVIASDPAYVDAIPPAYMSHKDLYSNALRKSCHTVTKMAELGIIDTR